MWLVHPCCQDVASISLHKIERPVTMLNLVEVVHLFAGSLKSLGEWRCGTEYRSS